MRRFNLHQVRAVLLLLCGVITFSPAVTSESTADEWEFMLAPLFLWGMNIDGGAVIDGNAAPLDLDFQDDILENLEAAMTLHFEARKGDLLLFSEYQYVNLQPDVEGGFGPVSVNADIDFTVQMAEVGGGYVISRSGSTRWELLGGVRWSDQDIDVDISAAGPGVLPLPNKVEGGDDWFQPFVGGRVYTEFAESWTLIVRSDVAYAGSDNNTFHINAMVDYRFNYWGSVFGGYRYMSFDYDDNGYAYDAVQQGPMLGLGIYW
jgi:hypothetical protein